MSVCRRQNRQKAHQELSLIAPGTYQLKYVNAFGQVNVSSQL